MVGLKIGKYAVLRYVPDENREEFINIGLVFHCPDDGYIDFKITNNFSRVTAFDDEIDISFLKLILDGIKEDLSQSTITGPAFEDLNSPKFLDNYTRHFVNQIQFSRVRSIRTENVETDFRDLFRTYVYFDVHKKKRITDDEVKSIMNRVLRSNDILKSMERNLSVDIGTEAIKLDYAYQTRDKLKIIKTFSFDYTSRQSNQATQTAKEWAYNFLKLKPKFKDTNTDFIAFVYADKENKNIKTALQILNEETQTIQAREIEEVLEFASNIVQEIEMKNLVLKR